MRDADRVNLVKAFSCLASQPAVKVSLMQAISRSTDKPSA